MQFRHAAVALAVFLAPVHAFADRHREDVMFAGGPWWGSELKGAQTLLAIPIKKHSKTFEGSILLGSGYYEGTEDEANVVLVPYLFGFRWSWWHTVPKKKTMPVTQLLLARVRREETKPQDGIGPGDIPSMQHSISYRWAVLFNPGLEWSLGRGVRFRVQGDFFMRQVGDTSWKFGKGFSMGVTVGLR